MSLSTLIPLAAEEGAGVTPFVVGGTAFVILMLLLFAIVTFGKGRDHS